MELAERTGSTHAGMYFLSAVLFLGAVGTLLIKRSMGEKSKPSDSENGLQSDSQGVSVDASV